MKRPLHAAATLLVAITCLFIRLDPSRAFVGTDNVNDTSHARRIRRRRDQPRRLPSLCNSNKPATRSSTGQGTENTDEDISQRDRHRRDFSPDFQSEFEQLLHWRRDVRRFRTDAPVDEDVLRRALSSSFHSAPSVGLSEPWRVVRVESTAARGAALENFEEENAEALRGYGDDDDRRRKYASLKLSGMREAPVQLAVFCDEGTTKGAGLGARTMPEMRRYSVVSAITCFWLAARSVGIGVGWVSILDAEKLRRDLGVSSDWALVAYLCVGYPEDDYDSPELERYGWEKRKIDNLTITSV